jgi:hypothetical protein
MTLIIVIHLDVNLCDQRKISEVRYLTKFHEYSFILNSKSQTGNSCESDPGYSWNDSINGPGYRTWLQLTNKSHYYFQKILNGLIVLICFLKDPLGPFSQNELLLIKPNRAFGEIFLKLLNGYAVNPRCD